MGDLPGAEAIRARAAVSGIVLGEETAEVLARHAARVYEANPLLHLTSVPPGECLERHIGEAFEGACLLADDARGICVDLGSGNGYPGVPLALSRGLDLVMVESKARKAAFLSTLGIGRTLARAVHGAPDLADVAPAAVLVCRAMEGWARVLPRLAGVLAPGGCVLLWAGEDAPSILRRAAWSGWTVATERGLPGRGRSRVWKVVPHE